MVLFLVTVEIVVLGIVKTVEIVLCNCYLQCTSKWWMLWFFVAVVVSIFIACGVLVFVGAVS